MTTMAYNTKSTTRASRNKETHANFTPMSTTPMITSFSTKTYTTTWHPPMNLLLSNLPLKKSLTSPTSEIAVEPAFGRGSFPDSIAQPNESQMIKEDLDSEESTKGKADTFN